jgi:hypothetical protein
MKYTIERERVTASTSYQEVEMIEAANLRWQETDDLPDGVKVASLEFGGITFKVYREVDA